MQEKEQRFFKTLGITYLSFIGRGSYGEVYLVFHENYKCNFVMKKVAMCHFNESEIQCLKQLDDSNIVNLYDFYKFENNVNMLLEYCPNDLDKLMREVKELNPDLLMRYCYEVLSGIKACHSRNIAHCDIKPSNFLIDKYGRIKITDFGLSTIYSQNPMSSSFKGTKMFMAPEMFMKKPFNPMAADIWAVGVTLYYLASYQYPFFALDVKQLAESIKCGMYPDNVIADNHLRTLIRRCLQVDPNHRATIDELLASPYFYNMQPSQQSNNQLQIRRSDIGCRSHQIFHPKLRNRSLFGSNICHLCGKMSPKKVLFISKSPDP